MVPGQISRAQKPSVRGRRAGTTRGALLRVLFLHRNTDRVGRCLQALRSVDLTVRADVARTSEQFSERLRAKAYDLVLAEYPNAVGSGPLALQRLRRIQFDKHVPLIFMADDLRRDTAADLISQGAADCIDGAQLSHLPVAIRRALDENRLREQCDRAEQQLRHSEAHYRALVGNLTYGMCRCDAAGRFLDVNQTLVTMLGYPSRDALLAQNLTAAVLGDASRRAQLLGRGSNGAPAVPLETAWKRQDGSLLKIRLSGRGVGSDDGRLEVYELIVEDITRQRELEDLLREQAAKDPLTGLANYRHLALVLDTEIKRSRRTGREFSLLLFDVDGLKQINDQHGHVCGSQALCRVADVLCLFSRTIDTAARLGGDEFALVLPETGQAGAGHVARRIQQRLSLDRGEPAVSVSVGLAVHPQDGDRIDTLIAAADVAMYAMKDRQRVPPAPLTAESCGG